MWTTKVNRKELAEILVSGKLDYERLSQSSDSLNAMATWKEIELLWKDDPVRYRRPPAVMVVEDEEEKRDPSLAQYVCSLPPASHRVYANRESRNRGPIFRQGAAPQARKVGRRMFGVDRG